MTGAAPIAVDPTVFASLDPPRLAGSRCTTCGTVAFPVAGGCAKCTGSDLVAIELADHGILWTYTVQDFEPKAPYRPPVSGFVPFPVGYVDLGDVVVEARLVDDDPQIGAAMRLILLPLWDSDGGPVVTYAFERTS